MKFTNIEYLWVAAVSNFPICLVLIKIKYYRQSPRTLVIRRFQLSCINVQKKKKGKKKLPCIH